MGERLQDALEIMEAGFDLGVLVLLAAFFGAAFLKPLLRGVRRADVLSFCHARRPQADQRPRLPH